MIIVTSLSPSHRNKDNQENAIASWEQFGPRFSMNNDAEIEIFKTESYRGIEFVRTYRTVEHFLNKQLVSINAIIDFAIEKQSDLLIINSDIILESLPELKRDGMTIFSRYDYNASMLTASKFENGFDAFFIPHNYLECFPPSVYSIGSCWWDYFLPLICILNNIKIYSPIRRHAYHKTHAVQYSLGEWEYLGEHFRLDFKMDKKLPIGGVATETLAKIKSNLIYLHDGSHS